MAIFRRVRAGASGLSRSSWETRLAVGAPVLIIALSIPILLGAFSAASEGGGDPTAFNGYGPPPSTVTPTTLAPGEPCPSEGAATTSQGTATPDTVDPGGSTTITGSGFTPGAPLSVTLCSEPVEIGATSADGTGNYSFVVIVPTDAAAGVHEVVVTGTGAVSGTNPPGTHASVTTVTVTGAASTPATPATPAGDTSTVNPATAG